MLGRGKISSTQKNVEVLKKSSELLSSQKIQLPLTPRIKVKLSEKPNAHDHTYCRTWPNHSSLFFLFFNEIVHELNLHAELLNSVRKGQPLKILSHFYIEINWIEMEFKFSNRILISQSVLFPWGYQSYTEVNIKAYHVVYTFRVQNLATLLHLSTIKLINTNRIPWSILVTGLSLLSREVTQFKFY